MRYGFGVDLGGTTVKLAFFKETGEMLHKWEIPTDTSDSGSRILPDIARAVLGYLEDTGIARQDVLGIGIGVPGPVSRDGTVNRCVNLGWGRFNISRELENLTGLPVRAGNDANVAALGEAWKGGGQGCDNMVMATLGTGVGGGIVIDGKLVFGFHGSGGEIGHMVMRRDETQLCGCGKRGCVEQYCSATGIVRTAGEALAATDVPSTLRALEEITCKDVFAAAEAGDALALEIVDTVCSRLAEFLANVCAVVDPEIVVLGGGVSKAGEPLLEGIRRYLPDLLFHAMRDIKLTLATLGNDAGAYGAFKLILDEIKG